MAALGDEVLDAHMYPACAPYSCPYPYPPAPKGKGAATREAWRPRGGGYPPTAPASSSFPGYGQLTAAEYFETYQRAQLMALLSQMSPGLGPPPRRPSSRDVAVQVNPRRDASVQCSLGRRTLARRARDPGSPTSPQPARRAPEAASSPRPVRFPRTVAVYSSVVSRRLAAFLEEAEAAVDGEQRPGAREGERGPPAARPPQGPEEGEASAPEQSRSPGSDEEVEEGDPEEEKDEAQAALRASWEQPADRDSPRLPPRETRGGEAVLSSPEEQPLAAQSDGGDRGDATMGTREEPGKERLRFQVYFKQFCRTCQKSYNPYRVEDITCQSCKRTRCSCPVKVRHVDPKRPHRQDLCGRCKGKRLSCDSTFSFKYII
ncbi:zygote arrest protein 1 isoform X2 [Ochotona princeps]|uniref:zygote arrest protein 1 isoform X2 n=1 Tax=Ochotona princeps TaxID=9978 RepID=UPI0027155F84|nr:zygote arrest protein 1 isoform X2 [Ochotona princeps]